MKPPVAVRQYRESADAVLAKNLVVARVIAEMTQQDLAARALISRATIAQIETGSSDPRLSTITDLAGALGVPPLFLLVGVEEVRALSALYQAAGGADLIPIHAPDLERMKYLVGTGMLKDRLRAARAGATLARKAGQFNPAAIIGAAIFSAADPGSGIHVGTLLGELISRPRSADGSERV